MELSCWMARLFHQRQKWGENLWLSKPETSLLRSFHIVGPENVCSVCSSFSIHLLCLLWLAITEGKGSFFPPARPKEACIRVCSPLRPARCWPTLPLLFCLSLCYQRSWDESHMKAMHRSNAADLYSFCRWINTTQKQWRKDVCVCVVVCFSDHRAPSETEGFNCQRR